MKNGRTIFFKRVLLLSFFLICVLSIPALSWAEAYLAARTGFKCSQCHVNPTGGGKRNGFGLVYAQTRLPYRFLRTSEGGGLFDGAINDYISVGGDLRFSNKTTFGEDRPNDNAIEITEGTIYVETNLIEDFLTFYIDETFAPAGASNRETFGLIHNLPLNSYIKAGRILLPFGIRILDDKAFIREMTGFNFDNQDLGLEFGLEPGPFSLSVAVSNGTQGAPENNKDKQISSVGSVVYRKFRVGGSFSRNKVPGVTRTLYGSFATLNSGRFALLGEIDLIRDRFDSNDTDDFGDQLVFFAELDFLITKGINFKAAYDFFDPRTELDEDERDRVSIGIEPFLTQFLQVSAFYRIYESIPQRPQENEDQFTLEFHVSF